jgi:glutathione S-transferase
MGYKDQKEEGDKASKEFTETRMPIWLAHFDKVVKKHGPEAPVAGGSEVTYADFALFHVLDATVAQFNNEKYAMAWDKQDVAALKEYYEWMKSRPNLKAYFESGSPARKPFVARIVSLVLQCLFSIAPLPVSNLAWAGNSMM